MFNQNSIPLSSIMIRIEIKPLSIRCCYVELPLDIISDVPDEAHDAIIHLAARQSEGPEKPLHFKTMSDTIEYITAPSKSKEPGLSDIPDNALASRPSESKKPKLLSRSQVLKVDFLWNGEFCIVVRLFLEKGSGGMSREVAATKETQSFKVRDNFNDWANLIPDRFTVSAIVPLHFPNS